MVFQGPRDALGVSCFLALVGLVRGIKGFTFLTEKLVPSLPKLLRDKLKGNQLCGVHSGLIIKIMLL